MCQHINQVIDQHEGFITCTDCGKVMDVYFCQQLDSSENNYIYCTSDIKSYLSDCCDRMHVLRSILELIYNDYVHFRSHAVFKKVDNKHLMRYSIYFTLKNEGIGRNIEYVALNTGVASRILWKCESLDPYLSTPINIKILLAPAYSALELQRDDCKNISAISKHFQERHFSPLTLVSTLVYLYCKSKSIPVSIGKICSIFNVSSMSIYRCKSYITFDKFHCILENKESKKR